MQIYHIRNATCVIHANNRFILIDPMLSHKGELPPFSFIKHSLQANPTVDLPKNTDEILSQITDCLITHSQTFGLKLLQHTDHLDKRGEAFLISKNIPVTTINKDAAYLKKQGLNVVQTLPFFERTPYLDGCITAIPAQHGHGWIHAIMANGGGYFIELANQPTVYICGDTVLTHDVKKAITDFSPDIIVAATGNASLDIGQSLLMRMDEILELITISPKIVIANHMDALNHCSISRKILRERLQTEGLLDKVLMPQDGEVLKF